MQETKDSSTLILYVLVALIVVMVSAWLFLSMRGGDLPTIEPPASPAPATATDPVSADQYDVQQNLEMGALALNAGQLLSPADGSALRFYLDARALAPQEEAVTRGLQQLAQQIGVRARVELTQQRFPELVTSMQALETIDAADQRLVALRADLALLLDSKLAVIDGAIGRGQWDAAQALIDELGVLPSVDEAALASRSEALAAARQRAEESAEAVEAEKAPSASAAVSGDAPAAKTQAAAQGAAAAQLSESAIETLLASVRTSFDAGRLTTPVNDSASYYLREVREVEPDHPQLASGWTELVEKLAQRAVLFAQDLRWDDADQALAQAQSFGAATASVDEAREQIVAARIARESTRVVPVQEMQNVKVVRPRYPSRALRNNTEGWVVVNFTVQPDGSTADIVTVEASERYGDQFSRAAEFAVSKWQFVPRVFLGQTIPQRVRARVSFNIQK